MKSSYRRGESAHAPREAVAPNRRRPVGARPGLRLKNFLRGHFHAWRDGLVRLLKTPPTSLMTMGAIGITLALPTAMLVVVLNLLDLDAGLERSAQVSLFLQPGMDETRVQNLVTRVSAMEGVDGVRTISPEQGLAEFSAATGFGDVLDALDSNPLPYVLVVQPRGSYEEPGQAVGLQKRLARLEGVEQAKLDMEWVQRLHAILVVAQRAVIILAGLLSVAVLLTVGNTIRMAIENRREEIEITKLIGASNGFVRRPFLYTGFWYGLFGGAVAVALVHGAFWALAEPVAHLTALYGTTLTFASLPWQVAGAVIGFAVVLGLAGAWLAVGRHLRAIEPR